VKQLEDRPRINFLSNHPIDPEPRLTKTETKILKQCGFALLFFVVLGIGAFFVFGA
jgi:hypothetical protein